MTVRRSAGRQRRPTQRGQTLVEFAFGLIIFTMLFVGMIELARAVFMFNGVSQAARELARETSVHAGLSTLGSSDESAAALVIQRQLVPGLQPPLYECVDIAGAMQFDTCVPGDWVRVTATARFQTAIPFLGALGPFMFSSTSSAEIQ